MVPLSVESAAAAGVKEAIEWLATGIPPFRPAWVEPIPFQAAPGFGAALLAI